MELEHFFNENLSLKNLILCVRNKIIYGLWSITMFVVTRGVIRQ